jgi:hypothetical protein
MGLRLTQGDEKRFFGSGEPIAKQNCHPDRSEAKWRDLLFTIPVTNHKDPSHPPLCHPDRREAQWRDLQCAPSDLPNLPCQTPIRRTA